jgi:protein-disulfide isomerase
MSSRKYLEERRQNRKRQNNFLMVIMAGGVVLVFAAVIYAIITSKNVNLTARQINQTAFTELEQYDLTSLGDPQAPVVIEAYSNFGCSHCADFALETGKLIEEEYIKTGQVSLVFRMVGYSAEAPALQQAADAAYCAGEQGSFWHFHDLIFANQVRLFTNLGANVSKTMMTFAELLTLNIGQFEDCVADGKYQELVYANQSQAAQLGVTGTPTFFINGVMLRGNQPYENFKQAIDEALSTSD